MKKRRGRADQGLSRKSRSLTLAGVERFEDRLLLTTYFVTNTQDNPTTGSPNDGTLRGEILQSNANPSTTGIINEIDFSFTTPGVQTISLQALLPAITAPVLINGTTSNGYTTSPLVQVDGKNNTVGGGPGFNVIAVGSEIRALDITGFSGDGIDLNGGRALIDGDYIGVNPAGIAKAGNTGVGVFVASNNNTIGGLTYGPNVISGNLTGIQLQGALATGNTLIHNYVGTDATGLKVIPNAFFGIQDQSANNIIGGVFANGPQGQGNLVSGNLTGGINISTLANRTLVEGNYVGTDITGMAALPNGAVGVYINSVTNTTIGGTAGFGTGNVISGNRGYGVQVSGATTSNIQIQGNNIGVAANGLAALGNTQTGVFINGSNNVTVGGSTLFGNTAQFANIIAYNGLPSNQYGVEVMNASMDGILSNSIYSNGNLGIKLNQGNAGISPPTITSAQSGGGQTKITGSYFGIPNTNYRIQLFSSQTPNPLGSGDGQNFLGDLDFSTDNVGQFSFTTVLQTGVPVGATISATATEEVLVVNNTSQFAANVAVTKAAISDLSISTSVPSTGPLLDENYTYTLLVTNNGPDPATNLMVADTIPANSTFVSATVSGASGTPTFSGGVVTYAFQNSGNIPGMPALPLLANGSFMEMITVKPFTTTGKFVNTATVTGDQLDIDPTNNTSTTTGTVQPDADLSVVLVPSTTLAPVGSPLTYTLVVSNTGPSTANNVITTVQFPQDFASIVVSPDQGSFTIDASNLVTIKTGILPSFSSSTITFTATPTAVETANTTATVTTNPLEADPNPSNNTVTVPVSVQFAADLGVTMVASPSPVLIGGELFYTIDVTNNGPSSASEPTVVDVLPANVVFDVANSFVAGGLGSISISGGTIVNGVLVGGTVQANLFSLPPNSTAELTIAVFPPGISTQLVNTVTVSDNQDLTLPPIELDPDLSNNTFTTSTLVSPADLMVTIDQPLASTTLFTGTTYTYLVTVVNNGPATAANVILNDIFTGGVTILSSSVGQPSANGLNVNLGDLAPGIPLSVTIMVTPSLNGYTGSLIDSASVSSDEIDPNQNNNFASSSNLVDPVDIGVLVASSPTTVLVGQPLVYVVAVTNYGPATATNIAFTDSLPAGVVFKSVTTTSGTVALSTTTPNTLTGTLSSLAPNATALITILVTPTTVETATDTATANAIEVDTNPANNTASASAAVVDFPGTLQFASSVVSVPENGGTITLTVDRTGGGLGAVSVDFATSDLSAKAGINYTAMSGTITFLQGQTTATITIPVLDDGVINGTNQFLVTLSNPTNGASIGTPSAVAVDVTNTDRDTVPPVVAGLIASATKSAINSFTITFDEPMDPARASFLGNYHLYLTNGATGQTPITLVSAVYNPSNNSVTLTPIGQLPNNRFYRVVINASIGFVPTDTSGNILSGSKGPGSNYDVTYGQGTNLTYTDAQNNSVNLKLAGGGIMQVFRANNGNASTVNLVGIVPHKSKLTGSVKKLKKSASGHTTIGSITGFGQFGNVFSSLTTPSFYVGFAPVSSSPVKAASISVPNTVSVESIPTPHVKVAKTTPKGPNHSKK